ncbi:Gfo/Idh/MocA family protein [Pseudonocardia humida]|uniref:Gfo/Idh/MocA family oxidoreductase n=1 Tax=Pseudonocardia humida TaxID=2800819 RepID=A0ABT0ZTV6_9PSEU|nr:Gfo/Idh/MocA family oxidoreductase [Pseudonocardia humida]MCO1654123.1 Gfo/Idh/MocA family oxidoreductase [Pseudonocardia humida]
MSGPLRVGLVGAGFISGQYSQTLARSPGLRVSAVSDLQTARAEALAAQHEGARVLPLPDLLAAPDVDVVLVLSLPDSHAELASAAIAAGKHVYVEKPLALSVAEGRKVVEAATAADLRVGCAPDTVLGTGVQTARAVVDAGRIGTPHSATAFMTTPGHERWHPDPEFYYRPGGGPLLDMGPYYLTALVHLLGPVERVVGASTRPLPTRTIGSGPRAGTPFPVEVDTTVTGILEHASGAVSTLVMSFDVWAARLPAIEVHGTGGSLSVPDPNLFTGQVELHPAAATEWVDVGVVAGFRDAGRGCGLADLAAALGEGRAHRAGAEVALHVLDVMQSVQTAADTRASVALTTTCRRPEPVFGVVDLV